MAVGVHIRYGKLAGKQMDKVNEAQRVPLTYYVRETLRLVRRVRADRVFVAADSLAAVAKFTRLLTSEFARGDGGGGRGGGGGGGGAGGDSSQLTVISQGVEARSSPMRALLTDLLLLGEANALVFTFSSNFGQIALHLNAVRHNYAPTYISLDARFRSYQWADYNLLFLRDCPSSSSSSSSSPGESQRGSDRTIVLDCRHVTHVGPEKRSSCAGTDWQVINSTTYKIITN